MKTQDPAFGFILSHSNVEIFFGSNCTPVELWSHIKANSRFKISKPDFANKKFIGKGGFCSELSDPNGVIVGYAIWIKNCIKFKDIRKLKNPFLRVMQQVNMITHEVTHLAQGIFLLTEMPHGFDVDFKQPINVHEPLAYFIADMSERIAWQLMGG